MSPLFLYTRVLRIPRLPGVKMMCNTEINFKYGYLMKKPIESFKKKSEYSVYMYKALDVRLFPNKRLNVDFKKIEIWVSHDLKNYLNNYFAMCTRLARSRMHV